MSVEDPTNVNQSPFGNNNPKLIDEDKVDNVVFSDFGLTPAAIKAYMFGITITDPETGQEISDSQFYQVINTQVAKVEGILNIDILPRLIRNEKHDYYENDAIANNHIDLFHRPILQVDNFNMNFASFPGYNFDDSWWKIYNLEGEIEIFPQNYFQLGISSQSYGMAPYILNNYLNFPTGYGQSSAPQAYTLDYVSGMLPQKRAGVAYEWEMPADLQELIIYECLNQLFMIWGRILGVGAGIASEELSIDGARQNIITTQSAMYTGSRADIDIINMQIETLIGSLKSRYDNGYTSV